jgi:hypothetical protein
MPRKSAEPLSTRASSAVKLGSLCGSFKGHHVSGLHDLRRCLGVYDELYEGVCDDLTMSACLQGYMGSACVQGAAFGRMSVCARPAITPLS